MMLTERFRHIVYAIVGVALSSPAIVISAHTEPDTPSLAISTISNPSAYPADTLPELEVTATALSKSVSGTAPTYGISQEKLKKLGVTDIADALHRLPGLNIRDYGGAGGMKTVSVRGFGSTHTGVVYDGVVISDCQSGQIDLSRYSLDNLQQLSLVIGDNNNIFQPAKTAASAAVITLESMAVPALEDRRLHLTAQLKAGSFGLVSPFIRVGKTVSDHFAISAAAEFTHAKNNYPFTLHNGKLTTRERRGNSLMNSGHGEISLRWRPKAGNTFDWKFYYFDNDRQLPGPVVLYNPVSNETLRDRNLFLQMSYLNTTVRNFKFRALGKFNWDASRYHDVSGKYPGGMLAEHYYQREVYLSGIASWTPSRHWEAVYAADYSYNNLTANMQSEMKPWRHSVLQSLSAKYSNSFLIATARLLWSIYDNEVESGEAAKDANKLSPSVSVSVRPIYDANLFLRLSYKNIFRMPTFNDSYYYHLGSVSLKPENTDQINFGVTYQTPTLSWMPSLVITADVYYNNVKDKIVAIPQNMFIWSMTNLEKVRAYGLDLTTEANFTPAKGQSILLDGNYSYQRVQPRTSPSEPDYNKQVAYTPVHSGAFGISWENPWVNVNLRGTGASARYGTNSNLPISKIDGYLELSAGVYRSFPIKGHTLDIRVNVTNLLNTQYEIVAAYPMPGIGGNLILEFRI